MLKPSDSVWRKVCVFKRVKTIYLSTIDSSIKHSFSCLRVFFWRHFQISFSNHCKEHEMDISIYSLLFHSHKIEITYIDFFGAHRKEFDGIQAANRHVGVWALLVLGTKASQTWFIVHYLIFRTVSAVIQMSRSISIWNSPNQWA